MSCVLTLNINFNSETQLNLVFDDQKSSKVEQQMQLDLLLAYNNDKENQDFNKNWKLFTQNKLNKKFTCEKSSTHSVDCDLVQLFELGSVHHEFYLINLKFLENSQFLNKLSSSRTEKTFLPEVGVMLTVTFDF